MEKLGVITQGIRGGKTTKKRVGYASLYMGDIKVLHLDTFTGHGDDYKEREEEQICIYDKNYNVIFNGTHEELILKLNQDETI